MNESFEEEVRAFLSDEEQLHLFDDLTKVNPVTTTTGEQSAWRCTTWGVPFPAGYWYVVISVPTQSA